MNNILNKIVENKKKENKNIEINFDKIIKNNKNIYEIIKKNRPFYISEFKRKSPSEGNIGLEINLEEQINKYIKAGTCAISVLTDELFFGGNQKDLIKTVEITKNSEILILQKDFIIDEKQIYLARQNGADLILLIARILSFEQIIKFKKIAENLNMGVLLEIHELEEYIPLKNENFKLIGINNRDLDTFQIYLNRFNVISNDLDKNIILIAESGIQSEIDCAILKNKADGFLVGTSLMKKLKNQNLKEFYNYNKKYFLKACGLRNFNDINNINSDLIGINFSPISKRKISEQELENFIYSDRFVAVFKNNSFVEICNIVEKYSFNYIQFYSDEISLEDLKNIKSKKIMAFDINNNFEYNKALEYAKYVDLFILDGSNPGSGETFDLNKVNDFPYPFLLAGGINSSNYNKIHNLKNCIGIDVASGIETDNKLDTNKISELVKLIS